MRARVQACVGIAAETEQDVCLSIEELQACVGPATEQEQASRTVRFDVGHRGPDLGHGGRQRVGHGRRQHVGGTGKGGIGVLDMNKTVEWDGVGGIEMRALHDVDGTECTAELDGHWEGLQFAHVCEDFDGEF